MYHNRINTQKVLNCGFSSLHVEHCSSTVRVQCVHVCLFHIDANIYTVQTTTGVGREGVSAYETLISPERTATNPPEVMEPTNKGTPMPWPLKYAYKNGALSSSAIKRHFKALMRFYHPSLREREAARGKVRTVYQILAREVVFGKKIMSRCTPGDLKTCLPYPRQNSLH